MIYDCFIFFNELDLLEIRLNVLNDVRSEEHTSELSHIQKTRMPSSA